MLLYLGLQGVDGRILGSNMALERVFLAFEHVDLALQIEDVFLKLLDFTLAVSVLLAELTDLIVVLRLRLYLLI